MNLRVTWITVSQAPYRLPVWEHVGAALSLEVVLLRSRRQFAAAPAGRGREWADMLPVGYTMREIPTWYVTRGLARHYVTMPFALRLSRETSAVLLGGWDSPSYLQALFAAKRARIPTVGFYESTLRSQIHTSGSIAALRRFYFRQLDAVVVPGKAAEEAVLAMNLPKLRIFRGFNAVDVHAIHTQAGSARRALRASDSSQRGHRYLYLGRLVSVKNLPAILKAFADAAEPQDSLTIAGTGELEAELRALNVPGVSFIGNVPYPQVPNLLAQHDTLILASTNEVWGLVVNEALAAGLHVVVSDHCGVSQSVQGMAGVFVVPPTVTGIRDGLVESRLNWKGPIDSPEILAYGPKEFADTFIEAFRYAATLRSARRSH